MHADYAPTADRIRGVGKDNAYHLEVGADIDGVRQGNAYNPVMSEIF